MKNKFCFYILPLCILFLFNGKKYDESVIKRIHLNVNICIEGQDCGAASSNTSIENISSPSNLYKTCIACHGQRGEGMGIFPKIAGQSNEYLKSRLMAYRNKETIGPMSSTMWPNAANLSDVEIEKLSEYIASF